MKDPIFKRLLNLHPKFSDLSLTRINKLLRNIKFDENKLPSVIHIAGTNGKGSTAAILKSILNNHGYTTHLYTTPHLVNFSERIQIKSKRISNTKLLKYLKFCEKKNKGQLITFFEITTAAAFKAFQDNPADFLILEVGLGGRFDATNVIKKRKIAALTPISLDHQDYLGNTLNKIAYEKLGILNSKSINFVNNQKPQVMKYIKTQFKKRKIMGDFYKNNWLIKSNFYISDNIKIDLSNLSLLGNHQKINAGLSIHIARSILRNKFNNDITIKALKKCNWPGRLQLLPKGKLTKKISKFKDIYLDGFHNIDGMRALISSLRKNKKILICSFLNNKKYLHMLRQLSKNFDTLIVSKMDEENSITKKNIPKNLSIKFASCLNETFTLINKYSTTETSIYFGGSLYFIGEVLKMNNSK